METEIYVERHPNEDGEWQNEWCVYSDVDWLASFRHEEDAHEWAETQSLEP